MAALRAMLQLRSTSSSSQPASTNSLLAYPDPSSSLSLNNHFFSTSGGILPSLQGPGSTGLAAAVSSVGGGGPSSILSSAASTNTMTTMSKPAQSKKVLNLGLHSGAACGNLGLVKFALDNGQAIDSVVNGVYPIHAASCSNANVAVVRYLIERGADVNARRLPRKYSSEKGVQTVGTTGSTPLHFAAANGCLAIVEILLRHGAIVDVIDKYGSSPLSVAAARNHPEVASLLHMHSCMQRGVQDMSPDIEIKDPFERRVSSDFGQRLSPTGGRPTTTTNGHQKDTTQPLARPHTTTTPATHATTTRIAGQRRISLPSIMESPNSPNMPAPRQSCDITRLPHSTEPLVRSVSAMTESLSRALGAHEPTISGSTSTKQSTARPQSQHLQKHPGPVLLPAHTLANSRLELPRSLQRSHTAHASQRKASVAPASQGSASSPSTSENSIKRRRSMESTALLSPKSALGLSRRKSFDQLASILRSDSKTSLSSDTTVTLVATTTTTAPGSAPGSASGTIRRSSDASTSSHATNSSVTTEDSVTTDNTSLSALSSPRCSQEGGDFVGKSRASLSMAQHLVDSGVASKTAPLTRSISQPCMEKATLRSRQSRPGLVTFASELETTFGMRPSLDISRLDINRESERERERTGHHVRHQSTPAEKDGDDDMDLEMPGQLFRRKTMQEQGTLPILLSIPRYHSMGPTMEMGGNSPNSDNGVRSGTNTPTDRRSLSRPPSPSVPRPSSAASGAYSTLSGSATVFGRFARMWSAAQSSNGIKDFSREGSGNGSAGWHVGEFAEATSTAAPESLVRSDSTRGSTRGSMLNRLSGIWSRR
ncbi:hypothetical protein BGZ92_008843, partial [Podila epicladia]